MSYSRTTSLSGACCSGCSTGASKCMGDTSATVGATTQLAVAAGIALVLFIALRKR